MKFDFKKIASVLAGAVMLTSTIGFAAAAAYPAPFSATGGAVVYGANAAKSDVIAAIKVAESVKVAGTTGTSASTTGETIALFTGSSKINVNDTISQVKSVLTSSELPTVLAKGSFSGNADATYQQTIELGSNAITASTTNRLVFAKQPTSSDDPAYGFALNTNPTSQIYNASVTFNKPINFTHADSKNQEITLFGQKYIVGSSTDSTNLVLYKSATKVNLDSAGQTSAEVTVNGKAYTVELVSASTTTAIISVTDEAGTTEQKEVTEGASKKINGISIAINTADSNNLKYTASIIAGADKVTLTSGSAVTTGDDATQIDGTLVTVSSGSMTNVTKIAISVSASDSDKDAIMPGQSFTDPVFKTFKVDFSGGLNIPDANTTDRESIVVRNAGDDKLQVKFTNNRGNEATIQYVKNNTGNMDLQGDDSGRNITVVEGGTVYKNEFVVVGNEDQGYLLKVSTVTNNTGATNYADDVIKLTDVFDSSNTFQVVPNAEGAGTVTIGGKPYTVTYLVPGGLSNSDTAYVTLNYPDTSGTEKVVYPTMQTAMGAKLGFYKPLSLNMNSSYGVKIPNGNGYTEVTWVDGGAGNLTFTGGSATGGVLNTSAAAALSSENVTAGQFTYSFQTTGVINQTVLYMVGATGGIIKDPALFLIEGKDDVPAYNGLVLTSEAGNDATDGIGVNAALMTWGSDSQWNGITLASNSNKAYDADLYGTTVLVDSTDSDQKWATISYPKEQLYANLYVGKADATVTPGSTGTTGSGSLLSVEDSAVSSVQDSNLIVVGGSCVNKVAAKIVADSEDPVCGEDFTTKTQVGTGQYIIKTVASPYNAAKVAVLVAGYEAIDTTNAVEKLLTGATTDKDTSQVYPIVGTA